jgi:hypothetical protein
MGGTSAGRHRVADLSVVTEPRGGSTRADPDRPLTRDRHTLDIHPPHVPFPPTLAASMPRTQAHDGVPGIRCPASSSRWNQVATPVGRPSNGGYAEVPRHGPLRRVPHGEEVPGGGNRPRFMGASRSGSLRTTAALPDGLPPLWKVRQRVAVEVDSPRRGGGGVCALCPFGSGRQLPAAQPGWSRSRGGRGPLQR